MSTYETTTAEQLKARLDAGENIHLIDVREDEEVAEGMIPGAVHIRLGTIPQRLDEIPREGEVVFICRSGARSGRACEYLAELGFERPVNMLGGMLAWNEL
ncbi:rhodanese-like domain-containing protein [Cohnella sp. REN36]|uniref:rhodanese-like domain-containing protein n=1 Tax=Cohnella sp. REN36 TaxID=2887347 RepID=UPI001D1488B6|nr:rhodanese-like domain-containing protein [Cohnella sp. REN36]MCC3372949.1 rhodanese-like domain-containing protein [Cohnella sp. REN36]